MFPLEKKDEPDGESKDETKDEPAAEPVAEPDKVFIPQIYLKGFL